jgi:cell division protein FtsB
MAGTETRSARTRSRQVRRTRFLLVGAVVLSAGILVAWFPARALYNQRASLAGAHSQLQQLQEQDTALSREKKDLRNDAEISRIARQQYQLVSPGQQAYEVLPQSGAPAADSPYAGDPGLQGPVAPSAASELAPGTSTAQSSTTTHHATHAESTFERMWHALEFWR